MIKLNHWKMYRVSSSGLGVFKQKTKENIIKSWGRIKPGKTRK